MQKTLFWLCAIVVIFSFFIKTPFESALADLAAKSFECFFRSERLKEAFDLDDREAIEVFGEIPERALV